MIKKYFYILIVLSSLWACPLWAASSFVVSRIQFEGLQRISPETAATYLPIKKGEVLRPDQTGAVIKSLYQTGFFEHIAIARADHTLIIKLVERPTIGQLKITGNNVITKDKITAAMKSVDVIEGRVFNRAMVEKIRQTLLNQYYQLGRYNAHVDVNVATMGRNRALVNIVISEGLVAVIRRINFIGNHVFSDAELNKNLTISTPGIFTWITNTDRFSQEKLEESLQNLSNYYMDRGYVRFAVKSSQAQITPDRKSIYVTIVVDEGAPYRVTGFDMIGDFVIPKETLMKMVTLKPNTIFSRQNTLDSEKAISDALGKQGYIFATIALNPRIDDVKKEIYMVFDIKVGKRIYVNHINFSNNSKTNDEALRRGLTQMESAVVSTDKLEESKHVISLLPYVKDVQMSIEPVPQKDNQVDVNYKVVEDPAAEAKFSIGYSQVQHVILGLGFNQRNFLGTGETFGINLTHSKGLSNYGIDFTDPYYTIDGISRTISLSISKFHPSDLNLSRSYSSDEYDASISYGIPIGNEKGVFNNIQLGYGYQNTLVNLVHSNPSQQVLTFVQNHGSHFQQLDLLAGYSRDSRDRDLMPTSGMRQYAGVNVYLPLANKSLKYYTAEYNMKSYFPITESRKFIFTTRGQLAYGNGFQGVTDFPFFKDFYAGGIDSVHGYEGNTLGPKDNITGNGRYGNSTGGNALMVGSLGLIFPNGISEDLRTTAFFDAGNVYNTFDNRKYGGTGSGSLRYSTGIQADYRVPQLGLVTVSLAKPLNPQKGDSEEIFQFSLGANLG